MKLKYIDENDSDGILILESEPQIRNLFIQSQTKDSIRVPFPYMQFVFRYTKRLNKFVYHGYSGAALSILGSKKSLTSLKSKSFVIPTDTTCIVCTDHDYDGKEYNTLFEMTQEIITLWWGTRHVIYEKTYQGSFSINDWAEEKDYKKVKWNIPKESGLSDSIFKNIINNMEYFDYDYDDDDEESIPTFLKLQDKPIINEIWSKENEIAISR